jgi:hypothetical protein
VQIRDKEGEEGRGGKEREVGKEGKFLDPQSWKPDAALLVLTLATVYIRTSQIGNVQEQALCKGY